MRGTDPGTLLAPKKISLSLMFRLNISNSFSLDTNIFIHFSWTRKKEKIKIVQRNSNVLNHPANR